MHSLAFLKADKHFTHPGYWASCPSFSEIADDGSAVVFPSSNEIHLKPEHNQCDLQSDVLPLELPLLLSGWGITPLEKEQPGALKMLPPPVRVGLVCPGYFPASNNFLKKLFYHLSQLSLHISIPNTGLVGLVLLWESLLALCPSHCCKLSLDSCALPVLEVLSARRPLPPR